jgi:hypothetical protein
MMTPADRRDEAVSETDRSARIAFCCVLAAVGAVAVTLGSAFQAVAWWFILVLVLGTLLEGGDSLPTWKRIYFCVAVGACFIVSGAFLFVLFGRPFSSAKFVSEAQLVLDPSRFPERLQFLGNPMTGGGLYGSIGIVTVLTVWISSYASTYTIRFARILWDADESRLAVFKKKIDLLVLIAGSLAGLAVYLK